MHRELLEHTPWALFPIGALILFLAVYVAQVVRAALAKRSDMDRLAQLPFSKEQHHDGRA